MALELGYAHPDLLLECLSVSQLREWEIFYEMEPWGCEVEDARFALLPALTYNINSPKNATPKTQKDFIPVRVPPDPIKQTVSDHREAMERIFKAFGKKAT